ASVAIHADGVKVAAAFAGHLHIWDADSGEELYHSEGVARVESFAEDARYVVVRKVEKRESADAASPVEIVNLIALDWQDSKEQSLESLDDRAAVVAVAGRRLFIADNRPARIHSWNEKPAIELAGSIRAASFDQNAAWLATANNDGPVQLWNARTGELIRTLEERSRQSTLLAFNAQGDRLVTGGDNGTIRIWDVRSGLLLIALQETPASIRQLGFSADGNLLLAVDSSGSAWIWDTRVP
ncbi:MAG: hypothetical protein KDA42_18035, partial [Planctomycetales bacterium]|nr:hypothetical protein [Planctomycetales bacterium]